MTQRTIWIATIAASAATTACALLGQRALTSVGVGLVFSLINESLFAVALRFVSLRRLSTWPKAIAWAAPLAWLGKQGLLLGGAYLLLKSTPVPAVPFVLAVLGYQVARLVMMMARPEQYIRFLLPEQRSHQTS